MYHGLPASAIFGGVDNNGLDPFAPGVDDHRFPGRAAEAYGEDVQSIEVEITTGREAVVHDLSDAAQKFLADCGATDGLLHVWVPHATAGLAVIETGAGSDDDLLSAIDDLLPRDDRWRHQHGTPGHGRDHVVPGFLPPYATLPVLDGRPALGTWQSICLVDTNVDNPVRKVRFSYLSG